MTALLIIAGLILWLALALIVTAAISGAASLGRIATTLEVDRVHRQQHDAALAQILDRDFKTPDFPPEA